MPDITQAQQQQQPGPAEQVPEPSVQHERCITSLHVFSQACLLELMLCCICNKTCLSQDTYVTLYASAGCAKDSQMVLCTPKAMSQAGNLRQCALQDCVAVS